MKRLAEHFLWIACLACFSVAVDAQGLWKYTDKNGKVTYSDKAPNPDEKAEPVIADSTGTVLPAANNSFVGKPQSSESVGARASARAAERESYRNKLDAAREELEQAKKALETGKDPTQDERQIVVGRGAGGQPTGANAVTSKPEYSNRIAALEAAIKTAEEKVATAERDFREKAPR